MSTVCCNYANTVSSSLSETGTLVSSKTANSLNNDSVVCGREVVGSKVFDHIIQNEEPKLLSLLDIALECFVESSLTQSLN